MSTMAEIRANHQVEHDELSTAFYEKKRSEEGITPQEQADFDTAHAQIWVDCEEQIKTASDYVAPSPSEIVVKVNDLEAWKANLSEWLKGEVGDPPEE